MPNHSFTSTGQRLTENSIHSRLMSAYKKLQALNDHRIPLCEGCGLVKAQGRAHIIAKSRCKQLRKTELIWDLGNIFYACHSCNQAIENPKGEEWKTLKNIDKCLAFIEMHDTELFMKFTVNQIVI